MRKNLSSIVKLFVASICFLTIATPTTLAQQADSERDLELTKNEARQIECLAKNVFREAGSESYEGKIAVAQVTMNRVESPQYADDVCKVVYQKNKIFNKVVCQFSWTCEGPRKGQFRRESELWEESKEVAYRVFVQGLRLPKLTEALYFHNTSVQPNWNAVQVAKIGNHIFYRPRNSNMVTARTSKFD